MSRRCRLLSSDNVEFGLREELYTEFVETLVRGSSEWESCISVPFQSSSVLEFLKDAEGDNLSPDVMEIRSVLGMMTLHSRNLTVFNTNIPEDSENLNNNLGKLSSDPWTLITILRL